MNQHIDKLFGRKSNASFNDQYGGTFMEKRRNSSFKSLKDNCSFRSIKDQPIIGTWMIRGTTSPIRYQLAYLGINHQLVEYEMGNAPEFSLNEWESDKDNIDLEWPSLPYLIHNEVRITEYQAIHKYIARKWGPQLLGADEEERANIAMIASVISEIYSKLTKGCYNPESKRSNLNKIIFEKVPQIVKFMGDNSFLVGEQVTWVDFIMVEQIDYWQFLTRGRLLQTHPQLDKYFERMTQLPGLAEMWQQQTTDVTAKRQYLNKNASINF